MALRQVTGVDGTLRIANQVAASFFTWSLLPGDAPGTWAFTARCKSVNAFLMTQAPDILVLHLGKVRWRWCGVALEYGGDHVHGTVVGQPEER